MPRLCLFSVTLNVQSKCNRNSYVLAKLLGRIKERFVESNNRERLGDWEADIIVGKNRKSGYLTERISVVKLISN